MRRWLNLGDEPYMLVTATWTNPEYRMYPRVAEKLPDADDQSVHIGDLYRVGEITYELAQF